VTSAILARKRTGHWPIDKIVDTAGKSVSLFPFVRAIAQKGIGIMKAIHTLLSLALLSGASTTAMGCFEPEDSSEDDVELETDSEDDPIYTITQVDLDESGNHVVSWGTIRRSEQISLNALEAEQAEAADGLGQAQQALTQSILCTSAQTTRFYSDENYLGDVICFTGNGFADLTDYCRTYISGSCVNTWSGDVRSMKNNSFIVGPLRLYSSAYPTYAAGAACCFHCNEHDTGDVVPDANACEEGARYVSRGTCNPGPCVP